MKTFKALIATLILTGCGNVKDLDDAAYVAHVAIEGRSWDDKACDRARDGDHYQDARLIALKAEFVADYGRLGSGSLDMNRLNNLYDFHFVAFDDKRLEGMIAKNWVLSCIDGQIINVIYVTDPNIIPASKKGVKATWNATATENALKRVVYHELLHMWFGHAGGEASNQSHEGLMAAFDDVQGKATDSFLEKELTKAFSDDYLAALPAQ